MKQPIHSRGRSTEFQSTYSRLLQGCSAHMHLLHLGATLGERMSDCWNTAVAPFRQNRSSSNGVDHMRRLIAPNQQVAQTGHFHATQTLVSLLGSCMDLDGVHALSMLLCRENQSLG